MENQARFQSLDGWRGICALLVALFHIPIRSAVVGVPFFSNAWLFVDFFFVLSGFVIEHAYGRRIVDPGDAVAFVIRRFGRLWPLHVVVLGGLVLLELSRLGLVGWYGGVNRAPFTQGNTVPLIVQNILLLQAARPESLMSWNGPSWSIAVEFWSYNMFALIALTSARHAVAVKATIAIACCVLLCLYSTDGMDVVARLGFCRCFFGFFTGQVLYRICASFASRRWQAAWRPRLATGLEAVAVACVVVFVSVVGHGPGSFAAPLLFAGVIYVFVPQAGVISRLMASRPCQDAGRYSYSIYMIHMPVILLALAALRVTERLAHVRLIRIEDTATATAVSLIDFGGEATTLCLAIAILAAVVALSRLTWRWIERPGEVLFTTWAVWVSQRVRADWRRAAAGPAE